MRGRRMGFALLCRSTSLVTGAVSPWPNARNFSKYERTIRFRPLRRHPVFGYAAVHRKGAKERQQNE
jgi:hypothetical protein